MLRKTYDEELKILFNKLVEMGALVEEQIQNSLTALKNRDEKLASQTIFADELVNKMHKEIEKDCLNLILHQQPVAMDLRNISACLKIVTDLERIGDHAQDIAEISISLGNNKLNNELDELNKLFDIIKVMLKGAVDSFVTSDIELALKIKKMDNTIDYLYAEFRKRAIMSIRESPTFAEEWVDILQVAKYLERVGDHAENITEWVVFSITGEYVDSLKNPKRMRD